MRIFLLASFLFSGISAFAQLGGSSTYQYLNFPVASRIAGLGGTNLSTPSDDISFAYYNHIIECFYG